MTPPPLAPNWRLARSYTNCSDRLVRGLGLVREEEYIDSIEKIIRRGQAFAVRPIGWLKKLMDDAERS